MNLVKLIIKTLEYMKQKDYSSAAGIARDLEISSKVAESLFRKFKKESCVEESLDRSKGGFKGRRITFMSNI